MRTAICSLLSIAVALIWSSPAGAADSLAAATDTRMLFESRDEMPHPPAPSSTTIYVDDDNTTGPWDGTIEHPYQHIQDGINSASSGDNVYVFEGTYYERISVDESIHLVGQDKNTTIIDGSEAGDVVTINAHYVNVTGFTIQRGGTSSTQKGINVRSNYNTIINNIVQDSRYGILLFADGTHDNSITHNISINNGRGLYLRYAHDNNISCNNFENNSEYGIILSDYTYDNHIYHNNFIDNAQNAWELYENENFWDDGYPSGGNYWSDFDEPGEGAYDNNGDGIVDSSYQIPDGYNQDMYPLVNAYDYPLRANANGPYGGLVNELVEFNGDAYGGTKPYSWYWDFGDGESSIERKPDHIYRVPGVYTVILTVTDTDSSSDHDTTAATIEFLADAHGPYEGIINEIIEFHGDVYGGVPPYHWFWEFGDGDTSELQNPTHFYTYEGEYTAVFTVTDSIGSMAVDSATVFIRFPFIWVDDDYDTSTAGWGCDHFDNITDGVNAAAPAGTVFVCNGIYDEQVVVNKLLRLIGENRDSTIVSGTGTGHVIKINVDDVFITGFTAKNGWWGIELDQVDSAEVNSCICTDNSAGIMLNSATNATIAGCLLQNNTDGILFYPESFNDDNRIIDNDIQYNSGNGILFEHCCHHSNLIQGNRITGNGDIGINMLTCWYNEISYNLFFNNDGYAICIFQCACGGRENAIHHNNFVLNNNRSVQAYDLTYSGQNYWYSQSDNQGNFWSDYDGQDFDGDGIGDTPYWIGGTNPPDYYPLMEPVGDCPFFTFAEGPSAPEAINIPIQFAGKAFGGIQPYIWDWEFGDGHGSGEQNPIHSYCDPDTYSVVLTVTDSIDQSVNDTISVLIENIRAIAQGPSDPVPVNVPTQFTGDVYGGAMPYTWYWDFGDGHDSNDQNPIHYYDEIGLYTVILTVTDSASHTDEDTILVSITSIQANAQGPSGREPVYVPIQFTGDVYGGFPPYTWYWNFGDGHDSDEQNPTHSYDQHGTYTVILSVMDSVGHTDDDTISVTIVNIHNIDKDTYYSTIQEAIDDAEPYNTICVSSGIYYENEITIDELIYLVGEDRNTTIIYGNGMWGNVIQTEIDSIIISGFTIRNCSEWSEFAGIKIHANCTTITDNILVGNKGHGIALRDGSRYNNIFGNEIKANHNCGIKLYTDCRSNIIFNNTIQGNDDYGIYLIDSSDSNRVYHNTFANKSSDNARDECVNVWDDGYPSGGNRWGDYTGSDEFSGPDQNLPGADGIGDTPYSIPGGSNLDRYPIVDDQPPEAIDDLIILLESGTKSTDGDMRLIWTGPEDDVGVTRYVIYRSTVAGSTGDSLAETTDTTYLDVGAAGDELTNFFYTVRAADAVGNKSGESNKVGEFDRGPINGE